MRIAAPAPDAVAVMRIAAPVTEAAGAPRIAVPVPAAPLAQPGAAAVRATPVEPAAVGVQMFADARGPTLRNRTVSAAPVPTAADRPSPYRPAAEPAAAARARGPPCRGSAAWYGSAMGLRAAPV